MWTVPVLGQSARELRDGAGGFEVSPDGTHIAFTPAVTSGFIRELWVMSSQGDNPQKALSLGENEWLYSAHWSPDGQRLAYIKGHRTPERYEWSIQTCNPKGTDRQGNRRQHLGRTFTRRPLRRHNGQRHQQQRVDAGRLLRTVTRDEGRSQKQGVRSEWKSTDKWRVIGKVACMMAATGETFHQKPPQESRLQGW
jgi:dipeptidyl aminopeptidase/acylaminoacyl peptidase